MFHIRSIRFYLKELGKIERKYLTNEKRKNSEVQKFLTNWHNDVSNGINALSDIEKQLEKEYEELEKDEQDTFHEWNKIRQDGNLHDDEILRRRTELEQQLSELLQEKLEIQHENVKIKQELYNTLIISNQHYKEIRSQLGIRNMDLIKPINWREFFLKIAFYACYALILLYVFLSGFYDKIRRWTTFA